MSGNASDINLNYDDFPVIGSSFNSPSDITATLINESEEMREISFSGKRENYVVCFIDMMNSTKISSTLSEFEITRYYTIFLNAMAVIVKNFGSTIIKNAGDCLIYYFPKTCDMINTLAFKDVIECSLTMIASHHHINIKLHQEKLPRLDYRISADYGKVSIAKSTSSQNYDLFGSAMNICAKINSKAPPNGMVIGDNLYKIISSLSDYRFEKVAEYPSNTGFYNIYSLDVVQKRNILNPFSRTSEAYFYFLE